MASFHCINSFKWFACFFFCFFPKFVYLGFGENTIFDVLWCANTKRFNQNEIPNSKNRTGNTLIASRLRSSCSGDEAHAKNVVTSFAI